jgi:hypothetical protein
VSATMDELAGREWLEYLESLACDDEVLVTLNVVDGELAAPRVVRHLRSIAYDRGADMLEIVADGCIVGDAALRYFIASPRRIKLAGPADAGAILVEDAEGVRTLIRLFSLGPLKHGRDLESQAVQMSSSTEGWNGPE